VGDEVHHPAEDDDRAYEKHKAVEAIAKHARRGVALGDAEDYGSEEREEHHRCKMVEMQH